MTWIILVITLAGLASAQQYSARVQNYFQSLESKYIGSDTCVITAKNKMNLFVSEYDVNKQYAGALVNLYTQQCLIDSGTFYGRLNENLRSGKTTSFWKTTEDLLNEGMVLLGEQTFPDVYRGCANKTPFVTDTYYSFKQFISTSLQKSTAKAFATTVLFNIKYALGLDVAKYSQFPGEKEVLLKSSSMFQVVSVTQEDGYRYVVLQYTDRVARSDEPVEEAYFCEADVTNSAPSQIHASVLLVTITVIKHAVTHMS